MSTSRFLLLSLSLGNAYAQFHTYVDPFIGTEGTVPGTGYNGGNTFPGAVTPFSMVKIGPDVTTFNTSIGANAGYLPDGNVTAFSLTHVSGTGGGPVYGVVSQMPLATLDGVNVLDNLTYMQPRSEKDQASVGYYRSTLQNGIDVELTATHHVGFLQYAMPGNQDSHVLVDVSHYLPSYGGGNQAQVYSNGDIDVSEDGSQYTGSGVYRGAFSHIPNYKIYFCGQFNHAAKASRVFTGPYTDPYFPSVWNAQAVFGNVSSASGGPAYYQYGKRVGSVFTFGPEVSQLQSKVGISFVSTENACNYIDQEIPHWDFRQTVSEAQDAWEDVFTKISTTDLSNQTRLQMFYTALYHTHLMPTDRTGENANWETSEPSYDDYYTLWDTFRCLNSLWTLISTDRAIGMVRSLIDIWRHEQFMPDGRSGNANGQVQGGSNSDNVLADAFVKELRGGINWTDGYLAMKTNAELTPWNNYDVGDPTGSTIEGRGALPDWLEYGYLTPNYDRSVSRTIEYSLNDFALSQVAKEITPEEYQKYLNRSAGWQYQWDPKLTSYNFSGFVAPRYANGSRDPSYDPAICPGYCEFGGYTYEALGWEYTWTVPFDMETLIAFMGGPNTTEARLDTMFIPGLKTSGVGSGQMNGVGSTFFNPVGFLFKDKRYSRRC
jgi:predicted alpha-1,2-mannosidase